jgi:hypothetical protein
VRKLLQTMYIVHIDEDMLHSKIVIKAQNLFADYNPNISTAV